MTNRAQRIAAYSKLDDTLICYWKTTDGVNTNWFVYLPGCGVGMLSRHAVLEHLDQTITVTPSIKMQGHHAGARVIRHGYLTSGVWHPCTDDQAA
jgi:hypothetical protein